MAEPKSDIAVVTVQKPWYIRHRSMLIVAGIIIALLMASAVYYYIASHRTPDAPDPGPSVTADLLTPAERNTRAKTQTGYSMNALERLKISAKSFKSFDAAYTAGKLLTSVNSFSQALQAYAVAEQKATPTQKTVDFYDNYGQAAASAGNKTLNNALVDKRIAIVKTDPKLDNFTRSQLISKYESERM